MGSSLQDLFEAARAAQARAYAPYSRFPVGAALRCDTGAIYVGCNVENASFPAGLCAESGAIAAMIAGGGARITEILVVGAGPAPIAPCGACRQRVSEFASSETLVYSADSSGVRASWRMNDLLPHAFGPRDLAERQKSMKDAP